MNEKKLAIMEVINATKSIELEQLVLILRWDYGNTMKEQTKNIKKIVNELEKDGYIKKDKICNWIYNQVISKENILKYYKRQERLELILEESV
jgi:hypothetical protein